MGEAGRLLAGRRHSQGKGFSRGQTPLRFYRVFIGLSFHQGQHALTAWGKGPSSVAGSQSEESRVGP